METIIIYEINLTPRNFRSLLETDSSDFLIVMLGQKFDPNALYNRIVHYYIDKKSYSKDKANAIAQTIVEREMQRRICKNIKCKHSMDEHVRAQETCLVLNCNCRHFVR